MNQISGLNDWLPTHDNLRWLRRESCLSQLTDEANDEAERAVKSRQLSHWLTRSAIDDLPLDQVEKSKIDLITSRRQYTKVYKTSQ